MTTAPPASLPTDEATLAEREAEQLERANATGRGPVVFVHGLWHTKSLARGPLLIISGDSDNTVPWSIANASYKKQRRNPGVTQIAKIPGLGHSLTIDSGRREVAETGLGFIRRFV